MNRLVIPFSGVLSAREIDSIEIVMEGYPCSKDSSTRLADVLIWAIGFNASKQQL
jgi:hypothetical protein